MITREVINKLALEMAFKTGHIEDMKEIKMIEDLGMLSFLSNCQKRHYAIYECPFCGVHFKALKDSIKSGNTKSCGCFRKINANKLFFKHGSHSLKLYGVWGAMIQRCTNPKNKQYSDYGMRGIVVCDEWKADFTNFYNWSLSNGYKEGLTIERKNNDKGYNPFNCEWATQSRNIQNRRLICSVNKSGFRGVSAIRNKWRSTITNNKIRYHLGYFKDPIQAGMAYNDFIIKNNTNHPLNIIM